MIKNFCFHFYNIIMNKRAAMLPVSQSIENHIPHEDRLNMMESQILKLKKDQEDMLKVLEYVLTENAALEKDMKIIYSSLEEIAAAMSDPVDQYAASFFDDPDDDMLN